jgi:glycosyltransferase involved in cell wall biosynthesis
MARICFFNTTRFWGGGEKWHFEAASYLASRGHRVLFVVHPDGGLHKRLAGTFMDTVPMTVSNSSFLNPLKFRKLVTLFRSEKTQTIVFNGSADVKMGALSAKMAGVPAIVYRRGLPVPVKNSALNRFLYGRMITHFLVNSNATAQELFRHLVVPQAAARTRTIYNGIDLSRFHAPYLDATHDTESKTIVIGTAGRLEAEKGHSQLLATAHRLKSNHLNFKLLIAGEGSQRPYLQKQIQSLGLTDTIQLLGFIANIEDFMRRLDIFVLPSKWEGFGYASAEAMATGLPVVAFNVSSNREVIAHDITGFLVPPENIENFAEKIMQLAKDTELRAHMGMAGQLRVRELFDHTKQLRKLEAFLCEDVLNR